jgi:hypothetical protein
MEVCFETQCYQGAVGIGGRSRAVYRRRIQIGIG